MILIQLLKELGRLQLVLNVLTKIGILLVVMMELQVLDGSTLVLASPSISTSHP